MIAHIYWAHHLPSPVDAFSLLTLKRPLEGRYYLRMTDEDIWTLND